MPFSSISIWSSDPAGDPVQIKINSSLVDNYEVVHFITTLSRRHRVQVQHTRWDVCPSTGAAQTHVAVAWDVFGIVSGE
jgi:hypothetical protein